MCDDDQGGMRVQVFNKACECVQDETGPTLKERKAAHDKGECWSLCAFCFEEANLHTKKECPHFRAQYDDGDTSAPVLEFCNHQENPNDCEGNCLSSLCPRGGAAMSHYFLPQQPQAGR